MILLRACFPTDIAADIAAEVLAEVATEIAAEVVVTAEAVAGQEDQVG